MKKFFNINSFMKFIVCLVILHGIVCITLSYILAFMGRDAIAESLSSTVVTEIVAPVIVYGIKALFENISKYNNWVEIIKGGNSNEGSSDDTPDGDICDNNDNYSEVP